MNQSAEIVFTTGRCVIRKLSSHDFADFYDMHRDQEVMKYTSQSAQTEAECMIDLQHVISQYELEAPKLSVYAIQQQSGEMIGTCAIVQETNAPVEIGYRLRRKHWGNGFATEVTMSLITYCRDVLKHSRLDAYCYVSNVASLKVLEKCGFKLIDTLTDPKNGLCDRHYRIELTGSS